MDDQQTLDELAALFLSPAGEAPGPAPEAAGAAAPQVRDGDGDGLARLTGPAPVRLRPKPGQGSARACGVEPAGVSAAAAASGLASELAAKRDSGPRLRLAGSPFSPSSVGFGPAAGGSARDTFDASVRTPPGTTRRPRRPLAPAVEAVVLGNLPGLADAWLSQYAQLLALRDGPVLLLHPIGPTSEPDPLGLGPAAGETGFDLEWIGEGGAEAAELLATLDDAADLKDRVEALLSRAAHPPTSLLVHAGNNPLEAARFDAATDWSLLSGNDPVAIQAAAATLRRLVTAAPALASASVGLMVMGSPVDSAERAASALDAAVPGVLDHPVEALGALPRMNPVSRTPLGFVREGDKPGKSGKSGKPETDAWTHLHAWISGLPSADADATATATANVPPASWSIRTTGVSVPPPGANFKPSFGSSPRIPSTANFAGIRPARPHRPDPAEPATRDQRSGPVPASARASEPAEERAAPPAPAPAKAQATARASAFTPAVAAAPVASPASVPVPTAPAGALLGRIAGALPAGPRLEAVSPGCPGQPGVQLALDEEGRLHLVARHVHSAAHPHPREAMLALRDASDWAREHQAWLRAAHPDRRVDASDPVPHLLTDRPDLGLGLAKKLGPALRLYLLHGEVCYALTEEV